MVVDQDFHAAGRTYFYNNTPAQVASDAQDLPAAAALDQATYLQNAARFGYTETGLSQSFDVLNQRNALLFDQLSTRSGILKFFAKNGIGEN